jgi:histidinol dehydrogenase
MKIEQLEEQLDNWKAVKYRMENEGIEYCFKHYSRFDEIKDEDFHYIRERLISMMEEMEEFVKQKISDTQDSIDEYEESIEL